MLGSRPWTRLQTKANPVPLPLALHENALFVHQDPVCWTREHIPPKELGDPPMRLIEPEGHGTGRNRTRTVF